jgi:hypothetical protein
MRELHELYKLLLERMENDFKRCGHIDGICTTIMDLDLSRTEKINITTHFEENLPSEIQHEEFFNHKSFKGTGYWWIIKEDSDFDQRPKFIKKMIEITEPVLSPELLK